MRKRTEPRGLWEYKDQWIDTEEGRSGFYRYWYDQRSRRIKRKALAATDLQSAKEELISLLAGVGITAQHPSKVLLADVLAHYFKHKATPAGSKQASSAGRAAELVMDSMKRLSDHPTVDDLTKTNQIRAWQYMAEEEELTAKSISTYMISVRAAINWAAVPQLILVNDERVEVRLLESTIPVFCNEEEIAKEIDGEVSQARQWIPTYEQLGKWIDAITEEDDFRYVILGLNTAARNEAIFDLDVSKQVDVEAGIVDLNPKGRRQTKKRRPVIRLTTNLAAWLEHWGEDKPIRQYQDTVEKRLNKLGKPTLDDEGNVVDVGLNMPEMTCYVLRHFIATNLRRSTTPVSREQRSKWLGHDVKEGSKTTDWYEKFDPDYLEEPMRATDEIMLKLQKHTKRKILAPTMHPQGIVRVVK